MSVPEYGRAFGLWREAARTEWAAYTRHAFVEGLKDGTLPRECFLHYLVQDYVFLVHFSRAWALAVVKSETLEEMKSAAATVDGLVNHEMRLHVGICEEAGIPEADLYSASESTANLTYTRYVMDAGLSGDFADLMAALAPCVMGYGEIGARLAGEATADTPYRDWIETYAADDYQQLCRDVGGMIDRALERRIGTDFAAAPRWAQLSERFATATRLEVDFWQMGWDRS
ncbi:thiaminase/transcriptional activator TenA [Aliiruegeria haliotis]|uniref:Aminopyrimidine aminohydrolase n=1 Tax=Aliiruegeria haliotis TaxID=1280846 RepID=A0A2T0RWB2_9RHOB|nr:thiaminase II [Aliiruegeria haliotis]PRY25448.1 thiaminase/transcriptional activator TenA [Aliiruegeria haliotis]